MKDKLEQNEIVSMCAALMDRAATGVNSTRVLLKSILERKAALMVAKSTDKVCRYFELAFRYALKEYVKSLKRNQSDFDMAIFVSQCKMSLDYYRREVSIVEDAINEYDHYLLKGHLLSSVLLNKPRSEADMYDFRTGEKYGE